MNQSDELTDLLQMASRAVGTDVRPDPAALIARGRRRRRARGLCATAAMLLVVALALPAVADRDQPDINVAAGDPNGGAPAALTEEPGQTDPVPLDRPSTTVPDATVAPEPSVPPTTVPAVTGADPPPPPPTTSAPQRTGGPVSLTVPATPTTTTTTPEPTGPTGEPVLMSASGKVGEITLRFSIPVVPGDGPYFDDPSRPPPTDHYMSAMQLVSHMSDSTCNAPNGNAHEYLSGVGTDTLRVEASSLVVGTTWISITPGFAKNPVDGTPMKWVRCIGIPISG